MSAHVIASYSNTLLPIGLAFHPGEQGRFLIRSQHLLGTMMHGNREYVPANTGRHIIHIGGAHASYRQLLKSKLGRERLLELLQDEITASDKFIPCATFSELRRQDQGNGQ